MTTVEENVSNLNAILDLLRRISPNVRLVVTVSPVPLHATFERTSAIVSDCVSKSTLRVAAEEFCKQHDDGVFYWPAFEMIKWVSPHREPFFGIDDGAPSHISDDAVGVVVDSFLERCVVPAAKS